MNKKGFTLVELLAVIAILAVITVIAVVSLNGVRKNVDLKMVNSSLDLIMTAAKTYGEDHPSELPKAMTANDLRSEGLDIENDYNDILVVIYKRNKRATACINLFNTDTKNAISALSDSSNLCGFSDKYCKVVDHNNDGYFGRTSDCINFYKSSNPSNPIGDYNNDGTYDTANDRAVCYKIFDSSGIPSGKTRKINCP